MIDEQAVPRVTITDESLEFRAHIFQPSGALRWVERKKCIEHVSVEVVVLQQEWVNPYTGAREWRDIPTGEEGMKE